MLPPALGKSRKTITATPLGFSSWCREWLTAVADPVRMRSVRPFAVNGPNPSDASDDILTALDQWVEQQNAPDKFIATKYVNDDPTQGIASQRPLCPFPQFAKYKGTGSATSAASFACVKPDHDDDYDNREASNR
jgi:hypothetical protein